MDKTPRVDIKPGDLPIITLAPDLRTLQGGIDGSVLVTDPRLYAYIRDQIIDIQRSNEFKRRTVNDIKNSVRPLDARDDGPRTPTRDELDKDFDAPPFDEDQGEDQPKK